MILPPPAAFIAAWTAREHRNALVRLVEITLSHSAISSVSGGLRMLMPALLIRISIRPSSRCTRSVMAATAASPVTSTVTAMALWPVSDRSATASADFASFRPTMAMIAPAAASPRAMPRPMPPLPPVTIATLPLRSNEPGFIVRPFEGWSALALPDQDQAEAAQRHAVAGPLDLLDHEARGRPVDHAGALADPEQSDCERKKSRDQKYFAHGHLLASAAQPSAQGGQT